MTIQTPTSNGTTSVNTANGFVTYTPKDNFHGTDRFTYKVTDLRDNVSSNINVIITINSINDTPEAENDTATVAEDSNVTINILENDTDVDGSNEINVASLTITTQPTNGSATVTDGQINYIPNANYEGSDSLSLYRC